MRKKFVYPLLRLSWASYSIKATKSGTMQVNVENPQGGIRTKSKLCLLRFTIALIMEQRLSCASYSRKTIKYTRKIMHEILTWKPSRR